MSLGSNTGRHRGNVSRIVRQPLSFKPKPPKPRDMVEGSGKIPTFVIVGFLAFVTLIILIRMW